MGTLARTLEHWPLGQNAPQKIKTLLTNKWVMVFKNGSSKICGDNVCLSRLCHLKFFKGCISQILLGLFLNILTHMCCGNFKHD